jgi:predicted transposase/invertase (TIGR01784 family)
LQKYIAAPWTKDISPDALEKVDKSFITREYRKSDSDIIYKLKLDGSDVYLYVLLELQSKVDFTMPFRLLRDMVELLNFIFGETSEEDRERKDFKLPAIVPIILYNGEGNWTAVRSYREYTENHDVFGNSIIDFNYLLFDLNRTDDESIASTKKLLDAIFALDKACAASDDYGKTVERLAELAPELSDDEFNDLMGWTEYVHFKGDVPPDFEEEFRQALRKGVVSNMTHSIERMRDRLDMRWLEQGRQEGIQQGIQQGRQEGVQRGRKEGIQEMIAKMRKYGLSDDDIKNMLDDNPKE